MQAVELADGEPTHASEDGGADPSTSATRSTKKLRWALAGGAALLVATLAATQSIISWRHDAASAQLAAVTGVVPELDGHLDAGKSYSAMEISVLFGSPGDGRLVRGRDGSLTYQWGPADHPTWTTQVLGPVPALAGALSVGRLRDGRARDARTSDQPTPTTKEFAMTALTGISGATKKYINPVLRPLAAWMPPLAVLRHVGRRSGKQFETPVQAYRTSKGFVVGLAYDENASWALNMLAADGGEMRRMGRRYTLTTPVRRDADVLAELPAPVRAMMRRLDITNFMEFTATRA